ncbi:DUF1576 domain-containing protein [Roseateles sp.]|uniref:DUF1576 domain-containing protein n=1 Tax=Roseateles sp. TaxID=1971397 RepID=UPI00286B6233|nr:DUF1576 domain-containing protein [Roseateles sp.]
MQADPPQHSKRALLAILSLFPLALIGFAFAVDSPQQIASGLLQILTSRDTLITDYIGLGGIGGAFINAGLLTLIAIGFYYRSGAQIGGSAVAALFLVLGFALFGKSLLNVWFVIAGVWLFARYKGEPFAKHINTAFFGAALAPIFTEILFSSALPLHLSLPLAVTTSLLLGFVLAPAAAHLSCAHMGYTLYNIGFVAGIIGSLIVAVYKSYGFVPEPVFIWTSGNNWLLGWMFGGLFAATALGGWLLDRQALHKQLLLLRQAGQAPSDFVALFGIGATLVNMSLTGVIGIAYVLAVGGDLNGPTLGAILTIVGFSAYGKHPKNIAPIMLGVFLGAMLKDWNAHDASPVLAALFGTTLAPIAGRFGWRWGIVAGFVHSSVAQSVGHLHGGLVLYNNGFAAGLVAAILVPVILALRAPPDDPAKTP